MRLTLMLLQKMIEIFHIRWTQNRNQKLFLRLGCCYAKRAELVRLIWMKAEQTDG